MRFEVLLPLVLTSFIYFKRIEFVIKKIKNLQEKNLNLYPCVTINVTKNNRTKSAAVFTLILRLKLIVG